MDVVTEKEKQTKANETKKKTKEIKIKTRKPH